MDGQVYGLLKDILLQVQKKSQEARTNYRGQIKTAFENVSTYLFNLFWSFTS